MVHHKMCLLILFFWHKDYKIQSFDKLKNRYEIPTTQIFRYFQLRSYIVTTLKQPQYGYTTSTLEDIFLDKADSTKLVTRTYVAFCKMMKANTTKIKTKWETDLGSEIEGEEWDNLWLNLSVLPLIRPKDCNLELITYYILPHYGGTEWIQDYQSYVINVRLRKVHTFTVYLAVYIFTNSGKM